MFVIHSRINKMMQNTIILGEVRPQYAAQEITKLKAHIFITKIKGKEEINTFTTSLTKTIPKTKI